MTLRRDDAVSPLVGFICRKGKNDVEARARPFPSQRGLSFLVGRGAGAAACRIPGPARSL